jgi:hypothetical protein
MYTYTYKTNVTNNEVQKDINNNIIQPEPIKLSGVVTYTYSRSRKNEIEEKENIVEENTEIKQYQKSTNQEIYTNNRYISKLLKNEIQEYLNQIKTRANQIYYNSEYKYALYYIDDVANDLTEFNLQGFELKFNNYTETNNNQNNVFDYLPSYVENVKSKMNIYIKEKNKETNIIYFNPTIVRNINTLFEMYNNGTCDIIEIVCPKKDNYLYGLNNYPINITNDYMDNIKINYISEDEGKLTYNVECPKIKFGDYKITLKEFVEFYPYYNISKLNRINTGFRDILKGDLMNNVGIDYIYLKSLELDLKEQIKNKYDYLSTDTPNDDIKICK